MYIYIYIALIATYCSCKQVKFDFDTTIDVSWLNALNVIIVKGGIYFLLVCQTTGCLKNLKNIHGKMISILGYDYFLILLTNIGKRFPSIYINLLRTRSFKEVAMQLVHYSDKELVKQPVS